MRHMLRLRADRVHDQRHGLLHVVPALRLHHRGAVVSRLVDLAVRTTLIRLRLCSMPALLCANFDVRQSCNAEVQPNVTLSSLPCRYWINPMSWILYGFVVSQLGDVTSTFVQVLSTAPSWDQR